MNLAFQIFQNIPNLHYGISTRADGSMLLPERSHTEVTQNSRDAFFRKEGIDPAFVVSPLLVHGNAVAVVTEADRGSVVRHVDGLITNRSRVVLTITTADCLPLFLFDPKTNTIGLVHAGYRGLAGTIIATAIDRFVQAFGVRASDLLAGIGPSIGPCHYEVRHDVAKQFDAFPLAVIARAGKRYLNLRRIAQEQLLRAGVVHEHLHIQDHCTFEDAALSSARRDHFSPVHAMLAYIGFS